MGNTVQPKLNWYINISKDNNLLPRCPFVSVDKCPRFYESLSLLGEAGSTRIDAKEDEKLKVFWEKSKFRSITMERAVSILGPPNDPHIFSNFCPEISFERFGYFASSLSYYADDIDAGLASKRLSMERAPSDDWRWTWSNVSPMHYTECPLYSLLKGEENLSKVASKETRVEKSIQYMKDHKIISVLIVIGLIVIGIGSFTGAVRNILDWYKIIVKHLWDLNP